MKLRIMNLISLVVVPSNLFFIEWIAFGKQLLKVFVSEIISLNSDYTEDDILEYFAKGEEFSNHPILLYLHILH